MSKTSTLFGKKTMMSGADTTNKAGAKAFTLPLSDRLINLVMTGTLEKTFYSKPQDLLEEALQTLQEAKVKDPELLAKAICYGSVHGFVEDSNILGLVVLSTGDEKCKELFRKALPKILRTPKHIAKFMTMIRSGQVRGCGRLVKREVGNLLKNLSDYHIIKYGSSSKEWSLLDMFRLTRQKLDDRSLEVLTYLQKKEFNPESNHLAQVRGYQEFLNTHNVDLITQYNLPYEVVTSQLATPEAWRAIMRGKKIPYQFLLKNINNLIKYKCLEDPEILKRVYQMLPDPDLILSSKQMPHRLLVALGALTRSQNEISNPVFTKLCDCLYVGIENSIGNIPDIEGTSLFAIDVSGSMYNRYSNSITKHPNDLMTVDIASLYGASMFKGSSDSQLIGFDTELKIINFSSKSMTLDIAAKIKSVGGGGGTDFSVVPQYMLDQGLKVDTLIYVTDSEDWVSSRRWGSHGSENTAHDLIKQYRTKINPNLKVIQIQLTPTSTTRFNPEDPNYYNIAGWSDAVFKQIPYLVTSNDTQEKVIRECQL